MRTRTNEVGGAGDPPAAVESRQRGARIVVQELDRHVTLSERAPATQPLEPCPARSRASGTQADPENLYGDK